MLNDLRDRIVVQVDGQMKTGRDVVIAALLGAEEYGFSTAPLVVSGCIMMRDPATWIPVRWASPPQNPALRERYSGRPEFVETYFRFVAEEIREAMAQLGFRTMADMIGRVDRLDVRKAVDHWKARGVDLSSILHEPEAPPSVGRRCVQPQDHGLDRALDNTLIERCAEAIEHRRPVDISLPIRNVNRTVGTMLGSKITRRWGAAGLPDGTVRIAFSGVRRAELRRLRAPRRHHDRRRRRERLLRQGAVGRTARRPPAGGRHLRGRAEHHHRQRGAVRRHRRRGVRPRRRRRALRGAQQRRPRGGRGGYGRFTAAST